MDRQKLLENLLTIEEKILLVKQQLGASTGASTLTSLNTTSTLSSLPLSSGATTSSPFNAVNNASALTQASAGASTLGLFNTANSNTGYVHQLESSRSSTLGSYNTISTLSPIPLYDHSIAKEQVDNQMGILFPQTNGRKRKASSLKNPFMKDTFTRDFCCLPFVNSATTPSSQMVLTLEYAGLGRKKITFSNGSTHTEVVSQIYSTYPRLKNVGMFTLHKAKHGGNGQPIEDITLGSYDVDSLRKRFKTKSLIYLRPLQKNLDLTMMDGSEANKENQNIKGAATTTCFRCNKMIPLRRFLEHQSSCKKTTATMVNYTAATATSPVVMPISMNNAENTSATMVNYTAATATSPAVTPIAMNNASIKDTLDGDIICSICKKGIYIPITKVTTCDCNYHYSCVEGELMDTDSFECPGCGLMVSRVPEETLPVFPLRINKDDTFTQTKDTFIETLMNELCDLNSVDPIEILKFLQLKLVKGRELHIPDMTVYVPKEDESVNTIAVDRGAIIESTFLEFESIEDFAVTFEIDFIGESAKDNGGVRMEWIGIINRAIYEKYFEKGLRTTLTKDYYFVGAMAGISIIQGGIVPKFFSEEQLSFLFDETNEDIVGPMKEVIKGLQNFHLQTVFQRFPIIKHLFRKSQSKLSPKFLLNKITVNFKPEGSSWLPREKKMYSYFVRYLREVASGRRGNHLSLQNILRFITGCPEVPELGFSVPLAMKFVKSTVTYVIKPAISNKDEVEPKEVAKEGEEEKTSDDVKKEDEEVKVKVVDYLPKAHICSNEIELPIGTLVDELPTMERLLKFYDYAFSNTYLGNI
ncbi:uncharacterized protein [Clytia hemisphaerica]